MKDDLLLRNRFIQAILEFEYWNFNEYEDSYKDITCDSDWDFKGLDEGKYGYGGEKYNIGKDSTKELYCKFYEKHGFIEDGSLNTKEKCFTEDPLPAMYISLKDTPLNDLIKVFIERKYYRQTSEYCGADIPEDKIIIK